MHLRPGDDELEGAYVVVHGSYGGIGQDGPYPLSDIKRGSAWGMKEAGSGSYITGVFPDGVAAVELVFRDDYLGRALPSATTS